MGSCSTEDSFFDSRDLELSDCSSAGCVGNFQIWTDKNLDSVEDRRRSFLTWMKLISTDTTSSHSVSDSDSESLKLGDEIDNGCGGANLRNCDSKEDGLCSDNTLSRSTSCHSAEAREIILNFGHGGQGIILPYLRPGDYLHLNNGFKLTYLIKLTRKKEIAYYEMKILPSKSGRRSGRI